MIAVAAVGTLFAATSLVFSDASIKTDVQPLTDQATSLNASEKQQAAGFGFLIGFELASEVEAERFLSDCRYIVQSTSFGGTHSSGERRARWGDKVAPGFIRLSVGIEPVEVLWAAIAEAL